MNNSLHLTRLSAPRTSPEDLLAALIAEELNINVRTLDYYDLVISDPDRPTFDPDLGY
jgi:hypothetical protein